MAQIGSLKVQTASGPVEIPVFEISDVNYPVLRVETASGVGAINLVDPVDADLDYIRIETASGVKAVKSSVIQTWSKPSGTTKTVVDDFERASLSYYTGHTSHYSIVSGGSPDSSKHVYTDTNRGAGSHTVAIESSGLSTTPQRGDYIGWWFKYDHSRTHSSAAFSFAWDGTNRYRAINRQDHNSPAHYFQLHKFSSSGDQELIMDRDNSFWSTGQSWRFFFLHWANDGNGFLKVYDSSLVLQREYTFSENNSSDLNSGGIRFEKRVIDNLEVRAWFDDISVWR